MCGIENLSRILNQTQTIQEYLELALKVQSRPHARKSDEALRELLDMIQKRVVHLIKQLKKGIVIEGELLKIDELFEDKSGTVMYIFMTDMYQGNDHLNNPNS